MLEFNYFFKSSFSGYSHWNKQVNKLFKKVPDFLEILVIYYLLCKTF